MTDPPRPDPEAPPPLLGTWPRLYAVVIGNLVLMIAVFWLITVWYA